MAERKRATAQERMEKTREYDLKYKREKLTQFSIRFNNVTEADVLERLDSVPNKRQYIIRLIREDIAREAQSDDGN